MAEVPYSPIALASPGSAGHVAHYRIDGKCVVVLAIRHLREACYGAEE